MERLLGEGGMGLVYEAVHLELEKRVAVKIIRNELAPDDDLVARMLHEARTAAKLQSEHVACVLDVGRMDTGTPFIVMECLDGEDLSSYLNREGPIPPDVAVVYMLQACEAVAEAHAAGIVHCDIKPENLFLARRAYAHPIVKVLDFGIARNLSAHSKTQPNAARDLVGSPSYMAPEAMRMDDCLGPAADIWSLGAVLYELLTGHKPFDADTISRILAKVLGSAPVRPREHVPDLSEGLEAVVLRCLRKQPEERFASVAELASALAPHGAPGSAELRARILRAAATRDVPGAPLRTIRGSRPPKRASRQRTVSSVRRRLGARFVAGMALGVATVTVLLWGLVAGYFGGDIERSAAIGATAFAQSSPMMLGSPPLAPPAIPATSIAVVDAVPEGPRAACEMPIALDEPMGLGAPVAQPPSASASAKEKPAPKRAAPRAPAKPVPQKAVPRARPEKKPSEKKPSETWLRDALNRSVLGGS